MKWRAKCISQHRQYVPETMGKCSRICKERLSTATKAGPLIKQ